MAAPSQPKDEDANSESFSTAFVPTIQYAPPISLQPERPLNKIHREPQFPDGWAELVHLNGSIYYHNTAMSLLTTENISNPLFLGRLIKSKSDFWRYISQYPMHRTYLPPYMEAYFVSALAFGANERVLDEKTTTSPFKDEQIMRLTQVYLDLKASASQVALVPTLAYHIAKVMYPIEQARVAYGYGTPDARLYRDLAIPESTWKVILWDMVIGVIFCGTHKSYRTRLECTVPNNHVFLPYFRRLMQNMMAEWADSNLVATVFVSVSLPSNAHARSSRSLFAMTSIVTGLYHVWRHRQKTDAEIEDAMNYIYSLPFFGLRKRMPTTVNAFSLTLTACLLALPLATLQWSVLSFTVAIAAFALESTLRTAGHSLIALLTLLVTLSCVVFLFFWRIWRPPLHREMEEGLDPNVVDPPPPMWNEQLGGLVKAASKSVRDSVDGFVGMVGFQKLESGMV
ncbi:hypothetical protein DFH09DRAFT_1089846 [Mycena vulgaris]|nr:hypothetical protein DFH09DRAFT_1089846 [Mycena vulgaris]